VEQHDQQLSRSAPVPPPTDPAISAACGGCNGIKAGSSLEVIRPDPVISECGQEGIFKPVRRGRSQEHIFERYSHNINGLFSPKFL
jgi:hypothetical protein